MDKNSDSPREELPLLPTRTRDRGGFQETALQNRLGQQDRQVIPFLQVRMHPRILRLVQHGIVSYSSALKPTPPTEYSDGDKKQILKETNLVLGPSQFNT